MNNQTTGTNSTDNNVRPSACCNMTGEEKRKLAKCSMLMDTLLFNGCVNREGLKIIREYAADVKT